MKIRTLSNVKLHVTPKMDDLVKNIYDRYAKHLFIIYKQRNKSSKYELNKLIEDIEILNKTIANTVRDILGIDNLLTVAAPVDNIISVIIFDNNDSINKDKQYKIGWDTSDKSTVELYDYRN